MTLNVNGLMNGTLRLRLTLEKRATAPTPRLKLGLIFQPRVGLRSMTVSSALVLRNRPAN
jgi:hypothetical protein